MCYADVWKKALNLPKEEGKTGIVGKVQRQINWLSFQFSIEKMSFSRSNALATGSA